MTKSLEWVELSYDYAASRRIEQAACTAFVLETRGLNPLFANLPAKVVQGIEDRLHNYARE
jgi:hypothetical protein